MSDASSALAGLGSDLAFTISFAIARELLDGANESGISQDELVAVVLETLLSFKRAGADLILTYHACDAAGWLKVG